MFGSYEKLLDVPLTPSIPALFQDFLVLPVPQQDTQSRKHSKMPPAPRAFSPFPGDKEAEPDPRVCTQRLPWKTLMNQQKSQISPKTAQDEAQRAEPCREWELLQPLTLSPNTSSPAGSRQQESTGGHRDLSDSKARGRS